MTTLSSSGGRADRARADRPTMRDVADAAGVSLKTVSRVLNGESVLPPTAARVTEAIHRLGFQRNDAAAHLRRRDQASHSIGLVIEDVTNPFYSQLLKAAEDITRPRGYLLIAASSEASPAAEREILESFFTRRVDGILLVPASGDYAFLQRERDRGTPIVSIDRPAPGLDMDTVLAANSDGVRAGVSHLVAHGHRRIGFIGDVARFTGQERLLGYQQALTAHGIVLDERLVRRAHDPAAAYAAANELLAGSEPPSALFTGNNLLTVGALRALGPRRNTVALVGFDDFQLADMLDPPVTVVAQDAPALARHATEMLFRRLSGDTSPTQRLVFSTTLIQRGSGEIPPNPSTRSREEQP